MTKLDMAKRVASSSPTAAESADVRALETLWPALRRMAGDGASVLIKLDGGRRGDPVLKPYTVVVSGGPLAEQFFRRDGETLEDPLSAAVLFYNANVWKVATD